MMFNSNIGGLKLRVMMVVVAIAAIIAMPMRAEAQGMEYTVAQFDSNDKESPLVRTEWGVGFGATINGIAGVSSKAVGIKPRMGLQGHMDFNVCFGRYFAVEMEIIYEGGSIDAITKGDNGVTHRIKTRNIDFPVLLTGRLANGMVRISVGPQFTIASNTQYEAGKEVMLYGASSPTWNIAGGLSVAIARNLTVEARYIHSLVECNNQFEGLEFTTRPYRVTVGATFMF